MPVERLPAASWQTALGLGFVSAVFDNIPLTALALRQGGYDWGYLAYAVGFGGSMIWFGSSAGVALSNIYPEAKSVGRWLRYGWHVALAYVIGFVFMLALLGWRADPPPKNLDPGQAGSAGTGATGGQGGGRHEAQMATRRAEVHADNNLPEDYPVEVTASSWLPTHGYGVPPP